MERLTKPDDFLYFNDMEMRLFHIEDILGDEYDLERLRELVEADRNKRCVILPDVDERERQSMTDELFEISDGEDDGNVDYDRLVELFKADKKSIDCFSARIFNNQNLLAKR